MSDGGQNWAWLGLLKWSLSYSDGTSDSPSTPMDAEKKAFLEAVMKDGIIDENERMKFILQEMTKAMDSFRIGDTNVDIEHLEDMLFELRDIVEQIDYARAFCALQGLPFLLGCIQERDAVPDPIRQSCLGTLATLCQNNPPVQLQLLELGSIKIFSDLLFSESSDTIKVKIMQAISANVRNHELAEEVFCRLEQANDVFSFGFQGGEPLQRRTLFFLRALITADTADSGRVRLFKQQVAHVADFYLSDQINFELRELSLELITIILQQKKSINILLGERKKRIVSQGVQRVSSIRKLKGEEQETAAYELDQWEQLLVMIARAEPDSIPMESNVVNNLVLGESRETLKNIPQ
jgi:hsp70-interacting protein